MKDIWWIYFEISCIQVMVHPLWNLFSEIRYQVHIRGDEWEMYNLFQWCKGQVEDNAAKVPGKTVMASVCVVSWACQCHNQHCWSLLTPSMKLPSSCKCIHQPSSPNVLPVQSAHFDFETSFKASLFHSILVQSLLGHTQTVSLL